MKKTQRYELNNQEAYLPLLQYLQQKDSTIPKDKFVVIQATSIEKDKWSFEVSWEIVDDEE